MDKLGKSTKGEPMHYSVGAIIKKDNKYLLIDRTNPPLGFASIAGHIDEAETPEQALLREVQEEGGLVVLSHKLLTEEELDWNLCSRGIKVHYWHVYECEVKGDLHRNEQETKSAGWFTKSEIGRLALEPAWKYWFQKLGIIE